jgi:hypothetical protein
VEFCRQSGPVSAAADTCTGILLACLMITWAVHHFFGLPGGADSHRLATHCNRASPTAGAPSQSLTSEIRLTPLSQEVPSTPLGGCRRPPVGHLNLSPKHHTDLLVYQPLYVATRVLRSVFVEFCRQPSPVSTAHIPVLPAACLVALW